MFSTDFWKDALDRAFRTVAQFLLVLLGLDGGGLLTMNWTVAGVGALGAFAASILTSIVSVGGPANAITSVTPGKTLDGNPATDATAVDERHAFTTPEEYQESLK